MEPKMEHPKQYTPEEIAQLEKSRTISDAELLKGGAEYLVDEKGEKTGLDITTIQEKDRSHSLQSPEYQEEIKKKGEDFVNKLMGRVDDILSNYNEATRSLDVVIQLSGFIAHFEILQKPDGAVRQSFSAHSVDDERNFNRGWVTSSYPRHQLTHEELRPMIEEMIERAKREPAGGL